MILLQLRPLPELNVTNAVSIFLRPDRVEKLPYHIGAVYSLLRERLPITKGGTKAGFFV